MSLIDVAISQYLVKEFAGSRHNPDVLKYFDDIGHQYVDDDETPWCAAFLNWCAQKAGLEGSGKLTARSFLETGQEVNDPKTGDVCVLHRGDPNGWKGHAGIFITEKDDMVYLLGGNQGDTVCIAPFAKSRVLGYRRLKSKQGL